MSKLLLCFVVVVSSYLLNCVCNDSFEFEKFARLLCVPNKTDTSIVDKVVECNHNETKSTEKIALENKVC